MVWRFPKQENFCRACSRLKVADYIQSEPIFDPNTYCHHLALRVKDIAVGKNGPVFGVIGHMLCMWVEIYTHLLMHAWSTWTSKGNYGTVWLLVSNWHNSSHTGGLVLMCCVVLCSSSCHSRISSGSKHHSFPGVTEVGRVHVFFQIVCNPA